MFNELDKKDLCSYYYFQIQSVDTSPSTQLTVLTCTPTTPAEECSAASSFDATQSTKLEDLPTIVASPLLSGSPPGNISSQDIQGTSKDAAALQEPIVVMETTFPETTAATGDSSTESVQWTKTAGATKRGGARLTNSLGYSYVVCKRREGVIDWVCSVRNSKVNCNARVTEKDGRLCPSLTEHCHPPSSGATEAARVAAMVRLQANSQPHISVPKLYY